MEPVPQPERYREGFHVGQQARPLAGEVAAAARRALRESAALKGAASASRLLAEARADRPPADAAAVEYWSKLGVHDLLSAEGKDGCAVRAQLPPGGMLRAAQLRTLAALAQRFADGCVRLLPGGGIELRPVSWCEVPEWLSPQGFAAAGLEQSSGADAPRQSLLRALPQGQSRLIVRVSGARCLSWQIETLATLTDPPHSDGGSAAAHFVADRYDAGKVLVVVSGIWNTQIDFARDALAAAGFVAL